MSGETVAGWWGWRAGAGSKWVGKELSGGKVSTFQLIRELGTKGEMIFLKPYKESATFGTIAFITILAYISLEKS